MLVILILCVCFSDGLSNSKLSIHTGMGTDSWQILKQGLPQVVKLLDNFGSAADIKESVPGIVIVGRIYLAQQPQSGDPAATAQSWWQANRATIVQYPAVDFWEGYNEPYVGDVASMQWYSTFEVTRVQLLSENGLAACIGSFSVGVPDVTSDIWQDFYPAIDAALASSHPGILGLHEYSAPFMNSSYSGNTTAGWGWLTGRYRKAYSEFLIPSNRTIALVISENGIDGGVCPITGCNQQGGWKNFCGVWGGDCNEQYMQQLIWYDEVMRADDYVIGSTVFSIDIPGWDDFDIGPLTDIFTSYLQRQVA